MQVVLDAIANRFGFESWNEYMEDIRVVKSAEKDTVIGAWLICQKISGKDWRKYSKERVRRELKAFKNRCDS